LRGADVKADRVPIAPVAATPLVLELVGQEAVRIAPRRARFLPAVGTR